MARRANPTGSIAKFDPGSEPWRCCAESKQRPGERCMNKAVAGRRTCHMHGGRARGRKPINGRHTGVFNRLRRVYEEAMNDPTLLDIRESLALLDVIVHKAVERAEALDTPEFRQLALAAYKEVQRCIRKGEEEEARHAISELGAILKRGASEDSAMMAMLRSVQAQANTTLNVWDLRLKKAQVINERDLSIIFMRIHDVIVDNAPPEVAKGILAALENTILVPSGASPGATGDGYHDMPAPSGQVRDVEVDDGADG